MTDLQRAISDLGAYSSGRGYYTYESSDEGRERGYRVTGDDLRDYGRRLRQGERDAYSLWCASTMAERVPVRN